MLRHTVADGRTPLGALARSTAGLIALALTAVALLTGLLASSAGASPLVTDGSANYTFSTLNNNADPTFNQLLGINDFGTIAGYFGSGQPGHPNRGYELLPGYGQRATGTRTSRDRSRPR